MRKIDVSFVILSVLMGVFCYLTLSDIVFSAILFVLFISYYFLILRKKFINYYSLIDRVHTCYHFINAFVITLSVKNSYEDAYESATRIDNKRLHEQTSELGKYSIYDRVKYLRGYFNLSIYKMFLNVLDLYQDQGGNILNMSDNLIRECTRTEKVLTDTVNIGLKHVIEFLILWAMSIGILLFTRFGIADFYVSMLNNLTFKILIFVFFLFILLSIHLFFKAFTNLTIKEDSGSWKESLKEWLNLVFLQSKKY